MFNLFVIAKIITYLISANFKRNFLLLLVVYGGICSAQDPGVVRALEKQLTLSANDSEKVALNTDLSWEYAAHDPVMAIHYAKTAQSIAEKSGNKGLLALAKKQMGVVHYYKAEYEKAISCYIQSLRLYEAIGNAERCGVLLSNIGSIYFNLNKQEEALRYYLQSYDISLKRKDTTSIAKDLQNIGASYVLQKKFDEALSSFLKGVAYSMKEPSVLADLYNNIGNIYQRQNKLDKALLFTEQSYKINRDLGNKLQQAYNHINFAYTYEKMGDRSKALVHTEDAYRLAEEIDSKELKMKIHLQNANMFAENEDYRNAYKEHVRFSEYKDSILTEENNRSINELQTKYETDKKEAENRILKSEGDRQKTINIAVSISLILISMLAFFIYRNYRQKNRANILLKEQNNEIRKQKHIIEEKQTEILDSINYAKRLQEAILPSLETISRVLPESFIFYLPKDIVAGDFYWMYHDESKERIYLAAADCTGHGVPGAMVSVVCSGALNRSVTEFNISDPGQILDKTRELVLETFKKGNSEVKDGMDISLLCIDKKEQVAEWSGANNPLWYCAGTGIKELAPDKQPIGKTDAPRPFTTHKLNYSAGYTFYLFTDGFADQFGGPKGKKFKYRPLSDLLTQSREDNMHQQLQTVSSTFSDWKGDLEQVDDVCIIGVRV